MASKSRRKFSTTVYLELSQYTGIKALGLKTGLTDAALYRVAIDDLLARHQDLGPRSVVALVERTRNRQETAKTASDVIIKKAQKHIRKFSSDT